MLPGQHFRGYHKGALVSIICSLQKGQNGDNGLTGTNIPLNQAVHDKAALHIPIHFLQGALLSAGQSVGKFGLQATYLPCPLHGIGGTLVLPVFLQSSDSHQEHKEFIKHQALPGK